MKKKQEDKHNVITKYLKEDHPNDFEELERSLFSNADIKVANNTGATNTPMLQIEKDLEELRNRRLYEKLTDSELDRIRELEKKL
jgi:hypothetical protein